MMAKILPFETHRPRSIQSRTELVHTALVRLEEVLSSLLDPEEPVPPGGAAVRRMAAVIPFPGSGELKEAS